jgi:hypothetical protein
MRRIGGKECFACVAADKISVLVFVQEEEGDVRVIVVGLDAGILHERSVVAAQVGNGGVGGISNGNFTVPLTVNVLCRICRLVSTGERVTRSMAGSFSSSSGAFFFWHAPVARTSAATSKTGRSRICAF